VVDVRFAISLESAAAERECRRNEQARQRRREQIAEEHGRHSRFDLAADVAAVDR
jgi:hypothetical protein